MMEQRPSSWGERRPKSIRVQSVLYGLELAHVERALSHLDAAVRNAAAEGLVGRVTVAYGDCSPSPLLTSDDLARLRAAFSHLAAIDYTFFDANLGSAGGHNRLLGEPDSDLTVILNPDAMVFPDIFHEFAKAMAAPGIGMVEARQVPVEHPKDYEPETGETSWGSTACALIQTRLLHELRGFDPESFFLYCDDVDLSWRIRLAGYSVIHRSSAMVFHDKRLGRDAEWAPSDAERYYAAEAALMISYKYSRSDLTRKMLKRFEASSCPLQRKAAATVEARMREGRMPQPIDGDHRVGQVIRGEYAHHRFPAH